jgi:hypothetical protein
MMGEAEKITINLGYVDLGQIDLVEQSGFDPPATAYSLSWGAQKFRS